MKPTRDVKVTLKHQDSYLIKNNQYGYISCPFKNCFWLRPFEEIIMDSSKTYKVVEIHKIDNVHFLELEGISELIDSWWVVEVNEENIAQP